MVGIVPRVGDDVAGEESRHVVLKIEHEIDEAVEPSQRELHVAMIGEHGGFAEESGAKGNAGRIELWKMQLNDIMPPGQFGGDPAKGWREHPLADARHNRHADDFNPVHRFFQWKGRIVLICHHGDLMPAFNEGARKPLGIDGQSARMGTIICKDGKYFHERQNYTARKRGQFQGLGELCGLIGNII